MSQTPTDGCYFSKAEQWQPVALIKIFFFNGIFGISGKGEMCQIGKKSQVSNTKYCVHVF